MVTILSTSRLGVKLRTLFLKLAALFFHALLQGFFFGDALFGGVFSYVSGDFHGAELGAAHAAEVGGFGTDLGEGFVVKGAGGDGVQCEVELVFPADLARLRPQPRPVGLSLREIVLAASQAARIKSGFADGVVAESE